MLVQYLGYEYKPSPSENFLTFDARLKDRHGTVHSCQAPTTYAAHLIQKTRSEHFLLQKCTKRDKDRETHHYDCFRFPVDSIDGWTHDIEIFLCQNLDREARNAGHVVLARVGRLARSLSCQRTLFIIG